MKRSKKTKIKAVKSTSCNKNKAEKVPQRIRKYNYKYSCSICPRAFETQELLLAHHDYHIGIKRYYCEQCKKSYRSEKIHKNLHKKTFDFKCEICPKLFNVKAKYSAHMKTHDINREKIICGINGCTKFFISTIGLKRHRSSHSGLKNFVCHFCSKSFSDMYVLEDHIRRHNNDKRYPCRFCESKFVNSSARFKHELRHKNLKNYKCTQCEKSFVINTALKRHLLCHSKELPEACRFCAKRFSRLDNRRRHEGVMHGISEGTDKEEKVSLNTSISRIIHSH